MPRGIPKNKKRDRLFWYVVVVAAIAALFLLWFITNHVAEKSVAELPRTKTDTSVIIPDPGYELFTIEELGIKFQYHKDYGPLKASTYPGSIISLKSGDLTLHVFEKKEFRYDVWEDGSLICVYDGALGSFMSEPRSAECNFSTSRTYTYHHRYNAFFRDGVHRYIAIVQMADNKHFMAVTSEYTDDCESAYQVCKGRSQAMLEETNSFLALIIRKNNNLFTQDELLE